MIQNLERDETSGEARAGRGTAGRRVYDLIGIGFGPANLALGVALQEEAERDGGADLDRLFLEAKPAQCWHPDMLLENSLIQISVLKDMATVRNPRSRFTFLSYLHDQGRLFEFLNLRDLFPSRVEFNDYLCWVAGQLADRVRYGRRVRSIDCYPARPGGAGASPSGDSELVEVVVDDLATGEEERYLAKNVVVATGGRPFVPPEIELPEDGLDDGLFHSNDFMTRIDRGFPDRDAAYRFVVVGSGQSGAELFYCLFDRYPNADVTATVRGFGYKPADDSDFTNEVFFPEMIDFFYELPKPKQRAVIDSFRDVNYAVVDHHLIRKIYRALYDMRVEGRQRARLLPYKTLLGVRRTAAGLEARYRDLVRDEEETIEADGMVLCTGYRWDKEHPLLEGLADCFETDDRGGYEVLRDYRLAPKPGFDAGVYLQGYCESTHGISETVLSLLPIRAQDIVDSLLERREAETAPATLREAVAVSE